MLRSMPWMIELLSCTSRWSVSLCCENVLLDFHSSTSRPPSCHGPSSPAVAERKRARAPMRRASAASAVVTVAGLMMSGSSAASRSSLTRSHPVVMRTAAANSTAASPREAKLVRMVRSPRRSVSDGDTDRVVRRRSGREQRALRVPLAVVLLGVRARPVREDLQVPSGEGDADVARPQETLRHRLAECVAHRDFADTPEARVLDVAGLRQHWSEALRDRPGLFPE